MGKVTWDMGHGTWAWTYGCNISTPQLIHFNSFPPLLCIYPDSTHLREMPVCPLGLPQRPISICSSSSSSLSTTSSISSSSFFSSSSSTSSSPSSLVYSCELSASIYPSSTHSRLNENSTLSPPLPFPRQRPFSLSLSLYFHLPGLVSQLQSVLSDGG